MGILCVKGSHDQGMWLTNKVRVFFIGTDFKGDMEPFGYMPNSDIVGYYGQSIPRL